MCCFLLFFFYDSAPSEVYTLSLHDALPICWSVWQLRFDGTVSGIEGGVDIDVARIEVLREHAAIADRKSTRLNSSHVAISYAVFCLKKKKRKRDNTVLVRWISGSSNSSFHD